MVTIRPIGVARTPFETADAAPRQGIEGDAEGTIVLEDRYAPGLDGLGPGDRIDLLWIADDADRSRLLVRDGERGVFSTRSPHRPNPICVSPCEVLAIDPPRLTVRGVDMVDGTPVVDVKAALR